MGERNSQTQRSKVGKQFVIPTCLGHPSFSALQEDGEGKISVVVASSFPYQKIITGTLKHLYKDANDCASGGAKFLSLLLPRRSLKHVGIPVLENLYWHYQCQWPSYAFRLLTERERSSLQRSSRSVTLNHLSV